MIKFLNILHLAVLDKTLSCVETDSSEGQSPYFSTIMLQYSSASSDYSTLSAPSEVLQLYSRASALQILLIIETAVLCFGESQIWTPHLIEPKYGSLIAIIGEHS